MNRFVSRLVENLAQFNEQVLSRMNLIQRFFFSLLVGGIMATLFRMYRSISHPTLSTIGKIYCE